MNKKDNQKYYLKLYNGYGHTHDLVMYGHVLQNQPYSRPTLSANPFRNILQLIKFFVVKPLPGIRVQLHWRQQMLELKTSNDGFFKFEWKSDTHIAAGWHDVTIVAFHENGVVAAKQAGKLFVPHVSQYAFISDIDDTVLISHSASIFKRLKTIFTKNPQTRKTFIDVIRHYQLLATAHTKDEIENPFFYVSSSEWNLYNDLQAFFKFQKLPEGIFLLSGIKKWYQLLHTGKTKHQGKGVRIARIMDVFPQQKFVLLGDNSQKDPEIYAAIAERFPNNIFAVYIRNIRPEKRQQTVDILECISKRVIHTLIFDNNEEAIQHSRKIRLLE